jgi:acetyl-CoA acetyltransferase
MARNPIKDQVAIVGVGTTEHGRHIDNRTVMSFGLEAARKAIIDAGIDKTEIDGICGTSQIEFEDVHEGLGISPITWSLNTMRGTIPPHQIAAAAHAVFSGACETALVVHAHLRGPHSSQSAVNDALRQRALPPAQARNPPPNPQDHAALWAHSADPYGAYGGRYLWEFKAPREVFGMIAVNNRMNASRNPDAIMRTPITMEDYLSARMIREPLGLLDMDLPCDGGIALVITTAERARSLEKTPVYIHAENFGEASRGTHYYEQARSYRELSVWPCMRALWSKSDVTLDDVDVYYPYDGFTNIAVAWIEAAGYCEAGGAYEFLRANWDEGEDRLRLRGKTIVHPAGGSLSQGADQGFNYYVDAVQQLRGEAPNQVPGARVALISAGGIFHNSTACLLHTL